MFAWLKAVRGMRVGLYVCVAFPIPDIALKCLQHKRNLVGINPNLTKIQISTHKTSELNKRAKIKYDIKIGYLK